MPPAEFRLLGGCTGSCLDCGWVALRAEIRMEVGLAERLLKEWGLHNLWTTCAGTNELQVGGANAEMGVPKVLLVVDISKPPSRG